MTTTSEAGTVYANGRLAHARILTVGRDLFSARGYHNVSLREIARAAGMTHTGVTHHFRTKRHVLDAVLAAMPTTFCVEDPRAPWSDEDLVREVGALLARIRHDPAVRLYVVLVGEAADDPEHPAFPWLADRTAAYRRQLTAEVRRSTGLGLRDAEREAAAILALINGLIVETLLTGRPEPESLLRDHIVRSRALAAPSAVVRAKDARPERRTHSAPTR